MTARDRLAALLHEQWGRRLNEASEPDVPCPECQDTAARLLADPRTLLAAALATDEGKAALAEAMKRVPMGRGADSDARAIAAALHAGETA